MQKVISIVGTRPEIIRTSRILPKLDKYCKHLIVHTNQNFSKNLKDIFYEELELRQPDIVLETSSGSNWNDPSHTNVRGLGQQLADMLPKIEEVLRKEQPDKVFILGDTNSALCSIIAERMGIPVYHMESANRSYDKRIPEEVNRRLIDAISSYNLFYTPLNRHTLLSEGFSPKTIFQCGNPTAEILDYYKDKIDNSDVLERLGIVYPEAGYVSYCLADFHRTENVDDPERLQELIRGVNLLGEKLNREVICSIHPRTQSKLEKMDVKLHENVRFLDAMGYFDFVKLEKFADVILTDSGLVSEEACILGCPCVIIRDTTERPEAVECGSAMISGVNAERMVEATNVMFGKKNWIIPEGWQELNVSDRVVQYILGERQ